MMKQNTADNNLTAKDSTDNTTADADFPSCSMDDVNFARVVLDSSREITEISELARLIKVNLSTTLECQKSVQKLTEDSTHTKRRMTELNDNFVQLDQYSRKDVAILTGVPTSEDETQTQVQGKVLEILKFVRPSLNLTMKDFSAIHRNGKSGRGSNPPSITLKFLRLHEKDQFMTRDSKTKFKNKRTNIFHALCPGMIKIQNEIKDHPRVDFVY